MPVKKPAQIPQTSEEKRIPDKNYLEFLEKTLKENECKELAPSKDGKPIVVCKRKGKLEIMELTPLGD